ncbi:glycosyltransferase family 25 protein [Hydrogenophaga sp.]|uniref:glycosyltransferase family 25 protein n=1 Tax=Hydrogenophaga sp. TaxID=1904254 RepID=UPI003521A545
MNLTRPPQVAFRLALRLVHGIRKLLPRQTSYSFGKRRTPAGQTIEKIYVINLDREPDRWLRIKQELRRIRDRLGNDLLDLTERYAAVDARDFLQDPSIDADVDPYYTLADQLFVEPQPQTLPTRFDLDARIRMTRAEVAVARSHIEVWRRIARGAQTHALILEDDVWFHPSFARHLDEAWKDVVAESKEDEGVDVIYVSYVEARHGAPKTFVSSAVFRPVRGLWHLSGYILSKQGAQRLLRLLPCRGPVDLWINHQFSALNVRATRQSLVRQRTDAVSTNSYSILPTLSTIGAINSEGAALFSFRPTQLPVFAFGPANSGQSSLAIALSMLGYRCCSDLDSLPLFELTRLLEGSVERVFNAYVNVGCLESMLGELRRLYPQAKFIVTAAQANGATPIGWSVPTVLDGADVVVIDTCSVNAWRILCEHLRCAPPSCSFPRVNDLGERHIVEADVLPELDRGRKAPKRDQSPWVVECGHSGWRGVQIAPPAHESEMKWSANDEHTARLDRLHWLARTDTFTANLALFRPSNVEFDCSEGVTIHVRKEKLGIVFKTPCSPRWSEGARRGTMAS